MAYEEKIRDYLSNHLECLEDNLSLIQKEYPLENPQGAAGRIDILAKDKYGMYVIIEIKRSEQASRQALHELHKYIALFQVKTGIDAANIRCIIVSTVWHELLVPFSEYYFSSKHSIEGVKIAVNGDGAIIDLQKIEPIKQDSLLKICPCHKIFLFDDSKCLDDVVQIYASGLKELEVQDFCILTLSYSGENRSILYPYAMYIVISELSDDGRKTFMEKLDIQLDEFDIEESPYYVEENILGEDYHFCSFDYQDVEIGYPEKLLKMQEEWDVTKIHRFGRFYNSASAITDIDLLAHLTGIDGMHAFCYHAFSATKHTQHWEKTIHNSLYALYGNCIWEKVIDWLKETLQGDYEVSINIYNPQNIILSLYKYAKGEGSRYLPSMEVISKSQEKILHFVGFVTDNGTPVSNSIEKIIKPCCGNFQNYLLHIHMHDTYSFDEITLESLGLKYCQFIMEYTFSGDCQIYEIDENHGQLEKKKVDQLPGDSLQDYVLKNHRLIADIIEKVDHFIVGI